MLTKDEHTKLKLDDYMEKSSSANFKNEQCNKLFSPYKWWWLDYKEKYPWSKNLAITSSHTSLDEWLDDCVIFLS